MKATRQHDSRSPPQEILNRIQQVLQLNQDVASWTIEPLTTTNPTMRIRADQQSWIVKKSRTPRRDVLVSEILAAYAIPHLNVLALTDDWTLMQDAGTHTLENMPPERYDIALFSQLGAIAASALLLGMRDRKLGNIAIGEAAGNIQLLHIDYEGAFRTGLFNRLFRPRKYYRYLLMRLLFDVARHYQEQRLSSAFRLFCEGFCREWARINKIRPDAGFDGKMTLRAKLMLATGRCSVSRARKLLQEGFAHLDPKQPNT